MSLAAGGMRGNRVVANRNVTVLIAARPDWRGPMLGKRESQSRLPTPAEEKAAESWAGFGLNLPTFVGFGEDEATENADGRTGDHVVRIMLVGFDPAVGDKGGRGIGWNSQLPSITLSDEFGAAK